MADIALGSVHKIIKAGMAIRKAVVTARQNTVECKEIEELVATLIAILVLQLQNNQIMMNLPAINAAQAGLERTLCRALELINDCQESNRTLARRILGSRDMSKKLRRVKDDIMQKMVLGTFAATVQMQITMTLTNNIPENGAHHLHAAAHPQEAEQVDVSYSGQFTTDGYGCGLNNGVRMAEIGSKVCHATSSRSREMKLSELENISGGGGHPLLLRKEMIIRVQMTRHNSQGISISKLVAAVRGVEAVALGGEDKTLMLVIGVGLDSHKLTGRLRRKVGHAEVVELRTIDYMETSISAAQEGMRSSPGIRSVFPVQAKADEDRLISTPNPALPQHHSQHLRCCPLVTGEEGGSPPRNLHRPDWHRSSGPSSSDSKEHQLSPHPSACAEGVKGKGKQMIMAVQQHQKDAEQVDVSYSGHFTPDDFGRGLNNGVRMAAAGSEVCYATSSRSREMNLSGSGGGGHPLLSRMEIIIRVQMTCDKSQKKVMTLIAAVSGVESVTLSGSCKNLVLVIGVGLDYNKLTGRLRRKVGDAEVVELHTIGYVETSISAAPKWMRSLRSLLGMPSVFPVRARADEDLISKQNPPLPQNHSQNLRRDPLATVEEEGSSHINLHRSAWQRSSGCSSDSEEHQLSPCPSACEEGVKGEGKQMILAVQQHQKADAQPDGQPPRGFMAHAHHSMLPFQDSIELLDSMNPMGSIEHLHETTTDYRPVLQASGGDPVHDDNCVPFLRMYRIVFIFLFLYFFKVVIT